MPTLEELQREIANLRADVDVFRSQRDQYEQQNEDLRSKLTAVRQELWEARSIDHRTEQRAALLTGIERLHTISQVLQIEQGGFPVYVVVYHFEDPPKIIGVFSDEEDARSAGKGWGHQIQEFHLNPSTRIIDR